MLLAAPIDRHAAENLGNCVAHAGMLQRKTRSSDDIIHTCTHADFFLVVSPPNCTHAGSQCYELNATVVCHTSVSLALHHTKRTLHTEEVSHTPPHANENPIPTTNCHVLLSLHPSTARFYIQSTQTPDAHKHTNRHIPSRNVAELHHRSRQTENTHCSETTLTWLP